jgi:chromosome segregation ATPase
MWDITCDINVIKTAIQDEKKQIAIYDFKASEVKENDPEKTEKLENLKKAIEHANKNIKTHEDDVVELEKILKGHEEGITKIESGETKVSKERLDLLTAELIDSVTKEAAKAVVLVNVTKAE